ncbi:PAS domain-containing protein [Natrialba swarupiae]|uniref:PAS domain-containing protein n=1 Tax=Natrialba swarupiae TaxID=2448032 RepID=A0A5D5AMV2_9EURY|nr:hypothetical protein [Natrialba swarupiae]TYT60720.1 hypothetical protein FYC77_17190 [Natrialba swarupiae]
MTRSDGPPASRDDAPRTPEPPSRGDIATLLLSATGEILGVTESVTERTGYSAEDLRGTPLASILLDVPDALEAVTDRDVGNDGDAGVTPTSCSLAIRTADGDVAAFDGRLERLPRDGTDDVVVGTLHWRPRSRAGGETVLAVLPGFSSSSCFSA